MTVLIFPSQLEGEPLERHETFAPQTVEAWLSASVQKFERRDAPPITITINGAAVAPDDWALTTLRPEDTVRIYPQAKGLETVFLAVQAVAAMKFITGLFMPKIPSINDNGLQSGERLSNAAVKGNSAKLNSPVREVSGQRFVYPDYLLPPHRYFKSPREQVVELMLNVGVGEFDIPLSGVLIGDTPIISLGADAELNIFTPGADVSGRPEAVWWHECAEVGNTSSGTAGLALTATSPVDPTAVASSFSFNGFSVTIPSGAGTFPTGWAAGMIARIVVSYPYTVTDGGVGVRDIISGDITQLGLTSGDVIEITGDNAGLYIVDTATATDMTLNWRNGDPVTTLETGSKQMGIGYSGLRYRLTAASSSTISLERLTDTGATDGTWPGFGVLTTSSASIVLDGSSAEGDWVGPFNACPDGEVTNRIEWDIFFPGGLIWQGMKGEIFTATVNTEVQYRDYTTAGAWTTVSKSYSGTTLDQIGYTEYADIGSYIRPEVRFRRFGVTNNREITDKAQVLGLRSRLQGPSSYPGWTTMTLTVKGGDRISAQTESLIGAYVRRKLPLWNGTSWSAPVVTRSIAPWVAYIAKSVGYTDDDINLAELHRLGDIWDARGDYYDDAINDRTTVKDAINDALAAGFAELTIDRGLIKPVRDEPRTVFEQAYSPQNMTSPLVRQFSSTDVDDFDGVDVEYFDSVNRQWTTVECRLPGDAGARVEKMRIAGVTDETRAWRIGMRKRRAQKYRRWGYTFNTELDAMNSGYLSYVPLLDDVPGYGQSAILEDYAVMGAGAVLRSSEPLDWSAGGAHVVGLRRPDGTLSGPFTATRIDDYRLTIAEQPDFTPDLSWTIEPPHIYFGPLIRWNYPALVTEVSPSGNGCSVSAINYDSRCYDDDDNSPP